MDDITGIIVVLGVCVALPVLIVWIVNRRMANDTNRRADIVLAALDKNADIDVEEFLKKLNPPQKSTQEKLMSELKGGLICLFIGIVLVVGALVSWQQTPGHGMGTVFVGEPTTHGSQYSARQRETGGQQRRRFQIKTVF